MIHDRCKPCSKFKPGTHYIMLTNDQSWDISPQKVCCFAEEAIVAIRSFKPNLNYLRNNAEAHRFTRIMASLLTTITVRNSPLQHVAAHLCSIFPALMLQKSSRENAENKLDLQRRLRQWEECNFPILLREAIEIQKSLSRTKRKKKWSKQEQERKQIDAIIDAIHEGNTRSASRLLDSESKGLLEWTPKVVEAIKNKFPHNDKEIKFSKPQASNPRKVKISLVHKIIAEGKSKTGGISHLAYDNVKKMIKLKETGDFLAQALTNLANALSSTKISKLSHFFATRIIPIAKKSLTPRPVGVGDVFRRIVLKQ